MVAALAAGAVALPSRAQDNRGELLYSTYCIGCHTTQAHWREHKRATDWKSLKWQVSRWQSNTGLGWSDAEIVEVARYLNELYYHYPQTGGELGLASPVQPRR